MSSHSLFLNEYLIHLTQSNAVKRWHHNEVSLAPSSHLRLLSHAKYRAVRQRKLWQLLEHICQYQELSWSQFQLAEFQRGCNQEVNIQLRECDRLHHRRGVTCRCPLPCGRARFRCGIALDLPQYQFRHQQSHRSKLARHTVKSGSSSAYLDRSNFYGRNGYAEQSDSSEPSQSLSLIQLLWHLQLEVRQEVPDRLGKFGYLVLPRMLCCKNRTFLIQYLIQRELLVPVPVRTLQLHHRMKAPLFGTSQRWCF